jgi:hypothetical protein
VISKRFELNCVTSFVLSKRFELNREGRREPSINYSVGRTTILGVRSTVLFYFVLVPGNTTERVQCSGRCESVLVPGTQREKNHNSLFSRRTFTQIQYRGHTIPLRNFAHKPLRHATRFPTFSSFLRLLQSFGTLRLGALNHTSVSGTINPNPNLT